MSVIKGSKEYDKFMEGNKLTRKQAVLAHCYMCNGFEDSREDCQGTSCPLYPFRPNRSK